MGREDRVRGMSARLVWNPWLRRELVGERYYVWFFTFVRRLDRESVVTAIEEVVTGPDVGATAYSLNEVLGSYDHTLQVWVPQSRDALAVDEWLYQRLQSLDPFVQTHYFEAQVVLQDRHWDSRVTQSEPQPPLNYAPCKPDERFLRRDGYTEAEQRYVAALSRSDWQLKCMRTHGGVDVPQDVADALVWAETNNLAVLEYDEARIRLSFLISPPVVEMVAVGQGSFDREHRNAIRRAIRELVESLPNEVGEAVFYEGTGAAVFLGSTSIVPASFFRHLDEVLSVLNAVVSDRMVKIYTMVGATSLPLANRAELRFSSKDDTSSTRSPRLSDLGVGDGAETTTLEFKASAKLDVHRLVIGDQEKAEMQKVSDAALKTVCAMLNHSTGGRLVLGIAQQSKIFAKRPALLDQSSALLSEAGFTQIEPNTDLWISPMSDEAALWGVGPAEDIWDGYQNQLQRFFSDNIHPKPVGMIDIERRVLSNGIWVVDVQVRAGSSWYYVRHRDFCARDGARSIVLEPEDADRYKDRSPRRSSTDPGAP